MTTSPIHYSTIASPCISICRMDAASGLCEGCWRDIDEIANWAIYSDTEKQEILRRIGLRQQNARRLPGATNAGTGTRADRGSYELG